MLTIEQQAEILTLYYSQKMRVRAIARMIGVDRKSVTRVIKRRGVRTEQKRNKESLLSSYRDFIQEQVRAGVPGSTILVRIRERGYLGGRTILQDYVSEIRDTPTWRREAFWEIEFLSGECAQVDWGEFGDVFGDGKIHCFVMVLCYSRLLYVEFTRGEKFEDFIRCHENGFSFFDNKVPKECWYDNLTSAVTERLDKMVKFNARFRTYMAHHGIRPHACNPARGNEKGRVEDGVKYVRSGFWAGRRFSDFDDICLQSRKWLDEVANRREHRVTRKVPVLHFESEEKQKLLPMNPVPYDTDEVFSAVVSHQFQLRYETNRYNVPWTLTGMAVTVRVNDRQLKVFYHDKQVAYHNRCYGKYQVISKETYSAGLRDRKPADGRDSWRLSSVRSIGQDVARYMEYIQSGNRSLRSEVNHLLALATIYGHTALNAACSELLSKGVIGSSNLELLLQSNNEKIAPAPISFDREALNRGVATADLRTYDEFIINSVEEE